MVERKIKNKLLEDITGIENTAQNQQVEDLVGSNDWSLIEAHARDLREEIEALTITKTDK